MGSSYRNSPYLAKSLCEWTNLVKNTVKIIEIVNVFVAVKFVDTNMNGEQGHGRPEKKRGAGLAWEVRRFGSQGPDYTIG